MTSRFKKIDLDDAAEGMLLGADVLDHQGSVLLPKGAPLTESLLNSMRRRGIDEVMVIDDNVSEEQLDLERERQRARLAHLFRHCAQEPAAGQALRALLAYRLESLQ